MLCGPPPPPPPPHPRPLHLSYTLYKFETQEDLWTDGLNAVYAVVGRGGGGPATCCLNKRHTLYPHNDCTSVGTAPDYVIVPAY